MRILGPLFSPIFVQRRLFSCTRPAAIPGPRFYFQKRKHRIGPPSFHDALSPRDAKIAGQLVYLLQPGKTNLPMRPDGFIPVHELVNVDSIRVLKLNVEYLRALIRLMGPHCGLELVKEQDDDIRTPTWLMRDKNWKLTVPKKYNWSTKTRPVSMDNLPCRQLLLRLPLSHWADARIRGFVAAPYVELVESLAEYDGYLQAPIVAVSVNVEMALRLGAEIWSHPNGTIFTKGHLLPRTFQQAHLVQWDVDDLVQDESKESLLKLNPAERVHFRARERATRSARDEMCASKRDSSVPANAKDRFQPRAAERKNTVSSPPLDGGPGFLTGLRTAKKAAIG